MAYKFNDSDVLFIKDIFSAVRTHLSNEIVAIMTTEFEQDTIVYKSAWSDFCKIYVLLKKVFNLYNNFVKHFVTNKLTHNFEFIKQNYDDLKEYFILFNSFYFMTLRSANLKICKLFFDKVEFIEELLSKSVKIYNRIITHVKISKYPLDFNFTELEKKQLDLKHLKPFTPMVVDVEKTEKKKEKKEEETKSTVLQPSVNIAKEEIVENKINPYHFPKSRKIKVPVLATPNMTNSQFMSIQIANLLQVSVDNDYLEDKDYGVIAIESWSADLYKNLEVTDDFIKRIMSMFELPPVHIYNLNKYVETALLKKWKL